LLSGRIDTQSRRARPLSFSVIETAGFLKREWTEMPLAARIVMPTKDATWIQEMELPFPPFPGLGIRVDVYEVLNVLSVVVGDPGCDVTCIVELEDTDPSKLTEERCKALGFEERPYP
jgi:hypothetical protein